MILHAIHPRICAALIASGVLGACASGTSMHTVARMTHGPIAPCREFQPPPDSSVTPPVQKRHPNPLPPRDSGSGYACVLATVDVNGKVVNPRIMKTNNSLFAREFLTALESWQYEPAHKEGKPVEFEVLLATDFTRY